MADAMCGPSNALQNFQKHSSVDRTLQQDRLVSRKTPSQNFRSEQHANPGLLDHEFEAFQAGFHDPSFLPPRNTFEQTPRLHFPQAQAQAPSWATAFQDLQIAQPPQQSQPQHVPFRHHSPSSWQHDFQRQRPHSPAPQLTSQSPLAYQPPSFMGGSALGMQRPFNYVPSVGMEQSSEARWKGKGKWKEGEQQQDQEAFARAFEAFDVPTMHDPEESQTAVPGDKLADKKAEIYTKIAEEESLLGINTEQTQQQGRTIPEIERAFAQGEDDLDAIEAAYLSTDPEQTQEQTPNHTTTPPRRDDELASTAGELLDRVADNTTQKFQESSFLALMRRLRDHEVRVEGDKMVDVYTNADATVGGSVDFASAFGTGDEDFGRGSTNLSGSFVPHPVTIAGAN